MLSKVLCHLALCMPVCTYFRVVCASFRHLKLDFLLPRHSASTIITQQFTVVSSFIYTEVQTERCLGSKDESAEFGTFQILHSLGGIGLQGRPWKQNNMECRSSALQGVHICLGTLVVYSMDSIADKSAANQSPLG